MSGDIYYFLSREEKKKSLLIPTPLVNNHKGCSFAAFEKRRKMLKLIPNAGVYLTLIPNFYEIGLEVIHSSITNNYSLFLNLCQQIIMTS